MKILGFCFSKEFECCFAGSELDQTPTVLPVVSNSLNLSYYYYFFLQLSWLESAYPYHGSAAARDMGRDNTQITRPFSRSLPFFGSHSHSLVALTDSLSPQSRKTAVSVLVSLLAWAILKLWSTLRAKSETQKSYPMLPPVSKFQLLPKAYLLLFIF